MEISERYNTLPYPPKFFGETSPGRLAAMGTLLNLETIDPRNCRVLEFGCGDGSNLISHAFYLPDAKFVGIDISGEHIKTARSIAARTGITNIKFIECDLMDLNESEYGEFDYLIAHGLVSWIPEAVIDRTFELFGSLLSENGIGYVSYNSYPGAHLRIMVRELMMFHTKEIENPIEIVESGISILNLIADETSDRSPFREILLTEVERHGNHSSSDIFHDDLSEYYIPFRFSEISDRFAANGLQYLCESEYHSMSPRNLGPKLQEFLSNVTDLNTLESYLDFARGRQFRKTLFCKKAHLISRELSPASLSNLAITSTAQPENAGNVNKEKTPVRFVSHLGVGIEIDHLLTKVVLNELGANGGLPISFDEVLEKAKSVVVSSDRENDEEICRRIMLRLLEDTAMLELHTEAEFGITEQPEFPKLTELAKWQIEVGDSITSRFGTVIGLSDAVAKQLMILADGSRSLPELKIGVREFIEASDLQNDVRNDLENWVEESVANLSNAGVFV